MRGAGVIEQAVADHYEIRAVLGQGTMGCVYDAHDRLLNRRVALKVASAAAYFEALAAEAQALAAIRHPALPLMFAASVSGAVPYIVMERVLGTMVKTCAQGSMPTCPLLETLALGAAANPRPFVQVGALKP